jgi:hypothetical protein
MASDTGKEPAVARVETPPSSWTFLRPFSNQLHFAAAFFGRYATSRSIDVGRTIAMEIQPDDATPAIGVKTAASDLFAIEEAAIVRGDKSVRAVAPSDVAHHHASARPRITAP